MKLADPMVQNMGGLSVLFSSKNMTAAIKLHMYIIRDYMVKD